MIIVILFVSLVVVSSSLSSSSSSSSPDYADFINIIKKMSHKEKATVMQLLSIAMKSNDSSNISYNNINDIGYDQHTTRKLSSEYWKKNETTKITYKVNLYNFKFIMKIYIFLL